MNSSYYKNASEVVRKDLLLSENHKAVQQATLKLLRQALVEGEKSGEYSGSLNDIFAEVKKEQ